MQRLAGAVIEHAGLRRRHQRRDLLRDQAIMDIAVPRVDIDRVRTVPKRKPIHARHSVTSGPFGPKAGSVAGSGTLRMDASALACSALLARHRLYLPLGG